MVTREEIIEVLDNTKTFNDIKEVLLDMKVEGGYKPAAWWVSRCIYNSISPSGTKFLEEQPSPIPAVNYVLYYMFIRALSAKIAEKTKGKHWTITYSNEEPIKVTFEMLDATPGKAGDVELQISCECEKDGKHLVNMIECQFNGFNLLSQEIRNVVATNSSIMDFPMELINATAYDLKPQIITVKDCTFNTLHAYLQSLTLKQLFEY